MGTNSKIGIVIPCFKSNSNDSEKRKKKFILEIHKEVISKLRNLGYPDVVILPVDEKFSHIQRNVLTKFEGKVPKGEAIRQGIGKIIADDNPKIIICIDGSGRIKSEAIVNAIKTLDGSKCDGVIAERKDNAGITHERYCAERFEIFLIENKYNVKIKDGQCGCWGFVNHKIAEKKIILTAKGYEIELDFLTELLDKNLTYNSFEVEIESDQSKTSASLFLKEDNKSKIKFIAEKLGVKKWQLIPYAQHFNKTYPDVKLNDEYMGILNDVEIEEPI